MSLVGMVNEDDDNHSLFSSTNSDDEMDESNCHTHRSCGLHALCNGNKHQHLSIDSTPSISLSDPSQPIKGDIRPVHNEPGHRQKYDGIKWRRICSNSDCSTYLNGGIFFKKWLCRKHYLLYASTNPSSRSSKSITKGIKPNKTSPKLLTRQSNKQTK